jgi:PAS domain S-box-containing protein
MPDRPPTDQGNEIEALRRELGEARDALDAIRAGEVDGLVVSTPEGQRTFTLEGADFAYRAFVGQMAEGAATLNPAGVVLFANQSLARMLGLPLEMLVGHSFLDLVDEKDRASFQEILGACAGRGGLSRAEVTLAPAQGSPVSASVALRAFDVYGTPTLSMTVVDLTEQKALVVRLRGLAQALTEAELRERRRIARILHDHFQQLLVAAKLQVGCLLSVAYAEPLRASAHQIDDLLTEAIQASRTLAVELCPPVLHTGGLAAALEWLRQRMKQQHDLQVHLVTDAAIDPGTDDVRAFIFESVRELLLNVVKHAGVREARLTVHRRNGGIEVTVRDAGGGLAPTLNHARDRLLGGTGLFSIGQRLELLGGRLSFEEVVGPGTCVRLYIPVADLPD